MQQQLLLQLLHCSCSGNNNRTNCCDCFCICCKNSCCNCLKNCCDNSCCNNKGRQMQITTQWVDKQNIKLLSLSSANKLLIKFLKNLHCCNFKTLQYSDQFISWHSNNCCNSCRHVCNSLYTNSCSKSGNNICCNNYNNCCNKDFRLSFTAATLLQQLLRSSFWSHFPAPTAKSRVFEILYCCM